MTAPRPVRAGISWDAVRVTGPDRVDAVLAYLGDRTGAVLLDGRTHTGYWLVTPGTTATWPRLPGVTVLGEGAFIAVPPVTTLSGRQPYWQVPPDRRRFLTRAALLLRALHVVELQLSEWDSDPDHARRMATLRGRLHQHTHHAEERTHRWA